MQDNHLFNRTRSRLSLYYASTMGLIFLGLSFGVYRAISHANMRAIEQEIQSVAGTLHDSLEVKLERPGKLTNNAKKLFANLCVLDTSNSTCINIDSSHRHILSNINRTHDRFYYVRFYDLQKRVVAHSGIPPVIVPQPLISFAGRLSGDKSGQNYYLNVVELHTQDRQNWGYLEVGKNLAELDGYLKTVLWVLILGVPIALLCVGMASWWLAGLAMQPIYQSYRQIQQFTADAAHELRTPVAATQATVESALLQPNLELQEAKDIFQVILRQNARLGQLVADLLLLARMDRELPAPSLEPCCLNDVISDLMEEMAALAINAKVELTAEIEGNPVINVCANPDRLYRMLANPIVNALQYTPKGGKVIVRLKKHDRLAIVEVIDTGIGIAQTDLPHIFDRFYRVNNDRGRHTGGSGLGLAIVKSIVERHRGQISIHSALDRGTTVTIKLPLAGQIKAEV
jgi:two-component system OmpR family sensor kinase